MKLRGSVSRTPLPGYPKLQNNDGKLELQVDYHLNSDEISSLPEEGEDFLDERFPQFHGLNLRLSRLTLTPKNGHSVWLLELTYSTPSDSSGENPELDEMDEYDTDEYEEPLRACEDYRTNWDHVLLQSNNSKESINRSWWENATTTVIPEEAKEQVKWAKPDDGVPDNWHVVYAETMPGVTGRLTGAGVVTVTVRSSKKSTLARQMKSDYTRQTPPDTFGLSGEWLRCGSSIRKEGKKWALTVKYRNAQKIERRLYK